MNPDWKDYERQIFHTLHFEYPGSEVIYNLKAVGKKSLQKRQIDVGIKQKQANKDILGIAECKYLKKKIDVKIVDALIGKMHDVEATFGIIISALGHTQSAKNLAARSKIELKIIPFEFLKDYGFVSTNWLSNITEVFQQEVEYPTAYCKKCNKTNLYEIKIIRGFAEFGKIKCPECGANLFENRTDGEYRVIKRFDGENISQKQIEEIIVSHLIWTRQTWDRLLGDDAILFNLNKEVSKNKCCEICHKPFHKAVPGSNALNYKKRKICLECFMSRRTLLIDYGKS
jgi:Restriction endonuclease